MRGALTAITIASGTAAPLDTTVVYAKDRMIFVAESGSVRPVADMSMIATLRGDHNAQNAAAAMGALMRFGLAEDVIVKGLRRFSGLPHRLEIVGTVGRAQAINDSKATNADATEKALASFDGGLYWIAGGRAKEGGISSLAPYFDRIEKAYLIGEAAASFAETLEDRVPYTISDTIEGALTAAIRDSSTSRHPHPTILLSPACASYDQFKNFEERGNVFRTLVERQSDFKKPSGKDE